MRGTDPIASWCQACGMLERVNPSNPLNSPLPPGGESLPPGREPGSPYRVCLVCLGNICRSPMAEVILRDRIDAAGLSGAVIVDSAGIGDWHIGEPMYRMAREALAGHGLDGSAHRARQIQPSWLSSRDVLLAMDQSNLLALRRMGGPADRVLLFGDVAGSGLEVPDPYGGNGADFDHVLDLLQAATPMLVARLDELRSPRPA
jgi:protein-tyrosine phosphatase